MEKWSLAAFLILWNFTSIKSVELCQEGLEIRDSTQLSLTCNTSHLQGYAHFESGAAAIYSIGIACVDTNGSQSATYQIWDGHYFAGPEQSFIKPHPHSLGSECTLFGCFSEVPLIFINYALYPAMCVIDEDECSVKTHNCSDRAVCSNTVGGYNCSCQNGYDGDGFSCTDVDECSVKTHNCSDRAVCSNTVGGYNCSCQNGYDGDGFSCTDEDECSVKTHNCSDRAVCSNTVGGYNCSCQKGYDGDGFSCTGYDCVCLEGYSGDGYSCTDEDECSSGAQNCSELSLCINTPGGYDCVCLEGYSGDGYNCTGIDECEPECSPHASCVHTDNSYLCVCGDMYEGDGFNCTATESDVDGIVLEVSMIAVAVSVLLCLVITAAVIITTYWRRKHNWLSRIKGEWEVQKLDKNYHPVDPACTLSGSVKSVIEPLWEEQFLPLECTNQDAREKETCADEGRQFLTVSAVNDVCAEQSSQLQSRTCGVSNPLNSHSDISTCDSSAESLDSKRPGGACTSAFTQTKDESGFVSDTSSSVYLTFYPLNNKI